LSSIGLPLSDEVFPPREQDGLLGLTFLEQLHDESRSAEGRILVERAIVGS
jgi:hypothetical protein